jgi:hypothetical protein
MKVSLNMTLLLVLVVSTFLVTSSSLLVKSNSISDIITSGDNHRGYLGYSDIDTKSINNDGNGMDVVIKCWNIKPTNENVNLNRVCPDSSTQ